MLDGELPGILTLTDLNGKVETHEIETVLVVVPDVMGRMLGRHVPGMHFLEHVARHGLILPPGFFPGSDYLLRGRIDTASLRPAPWLNRTALVFCDVQPAGAEGTAVAGWSAPREILAQQVSAAAEMGLRVRVKASINYYLFNESAAILRARDFVRPLALDAQQLPGDLVQAGYAELTNETVRRALGQAGVTVTHTEPTGVPGQYRAALSAPNALSAADSLMLLKHCVRCVAGQTGTSASFMALPFAHRPGNTLTLKLSLWDRGGRRNIFSGELQAADLLIAEQADEMPELYPDLEPEAQVEVADADASEDGISLLGNEFARFLSGCQSRLPGMTPFFAPTVNSLKRLRQEATPAGTYDELLQAVAGDPLGGAYLMSTLSGSDANPYLATTALLAAGLDGLRRDAPAEASLLILPDTPESALQAMDSDDYVNRLLGPGTIELIRETWAAEARLFQEAVTDWERGRYFEHA